MRYRKYTGLHPGRDSTSSRTAQRGFTLLEVLIAVVILSVGLLGLAALQATSLKSNHASLIRSQIAILSYDMVDRMRANMPAVTLGDYDLPTNTQNTNCTTVTGCTPTQMANHDFFEWRTLIASALPAGEGVVCREGTDGVIDDGADATTHGCGGGTEFVVKLWWDENGNGLSDDLPIVMSFQP
jgi:type IV pilus assembly protein PilV